MPARVGCASGRGCGVGGCLQGRTPVLAVDPCSVPVLSSTAPAAPSFVLFNGSQRKDEQRVFLYWGRGWAFSPVIHICLVCLHQTRPILRSLWSAWGGRLPSSWASEDPGLSSSVSLVPHLPDWLRDARAAKYWPASSEPGLPRGLMGKEYLFSLQLGVPSTLEFLVGTF